MEFSDFNKYQFLGERSKISIIQLILSNLLKNLTKEPNEDSKCQTLKNILNICKNEIILIETLKEEHVTTLVSCAQLIDVCVPRRTDGRVGPSIKDVTLHGVEGSKYLGHFVTRGEHNKVRPVRVAARRQREFMTVIAFEENEDVEC
ncbi:hypothetical protein HELRODRAFT_178446 [Helobdella robusta]|uniref:Uncharacterized protein n=1 Tax=Helobdella robusta TaxID=6412 RepID=T1FD66_HELRO|nr:hypothetical protein HELRODRAFT_178446 [Helobdella robusta]ESN97010.1 hypothetical protein HELRODRAFT_178446 [Helobdella robusta]